MLAATFVTAILVTVVGTTILPVPADSYVNTAALPRAERPPAEHARTASLKEQSRMPAYAGLNDEHNQTRPVELPSNAPKTIDGGTSTYAKTPARWSDDQGESAARSSLPASDAEQPASNSNTKSPDEAATDNVNDGSSATAEPPAPHASAAASLAAAPNSGRNDCELRNRRIDFHGFRPVHSLYAHHPRLRVAGWHQTQASRRIIAGNNAHRAIAPAYSSF
jgi:hypothetical protein